MACLGGAPPKLLSGAESRCFEKEASVPSFARCSTRFFTILSRTSPARLLTGSGLMNGFNSQKIRPCSFYMHDVSDQVPIEMNQSL